VRSQFGTPAHYHQSSGVAAAFQTPRSLPTLNTPRPVQSASNSIVRKRFDHLECIEISDSDSDSNPPNSKRQKVENPSSVNVIPQRSSIPQSRVPSFNMPSTSSQVNTSQWLPAPSVSQILIPQALQQPQNASLVAYGVNPTYQIQSSSQNQLVSNNGISTASVVHGWLSGSNGPFSNIGQRFMQSNGPMNMNGLLQTPSVSATNTGAWSLSSASIQPTQNQPPSRPCFAEEIFQGDYPSSDGDLIESDLIHPRHFKSSASVPNRGTADA
jgi:hypothetical protein